MEQVDLLLIHGIVVTMNDNWDVFSDGAIAVRDDSIVAVGNTDDVTAAYRATETVNCSNLTIIPGLVNAHTHVPMTLLRGLNDDLRLDVWLGYLMPLEREFVTPEFVRLGTRLACAEMIRSGITAFADMYYFESDIAIETAAAGMRALLGQTILLFPTPDAPSYEDGLERCRQFIEEWNGHPLVQPAVAPHAWYTATAELLQACAELALEYDVPVHTHIAETAIEVQNSRDQHHMPAVIWNKKNRILETKLLAAHCVHIDQGEMRTLQKAGAGVAHCPTSNLKLSSGIAAVQEMLELGLNVGVGTDGPASNNDLDMFEEMRLAALLAKIKRDDPTDLPARQALWLATRGGAAALHMAELTGSLEVGKRADIAFVETNGVHNWPHFHNNPDNVYSRLVYAAKSTDVVHTICNGRWLLRDRALQTVDERAAQAEAAIVAAQIDAFVQQREASPYNKLIILAGTQREESFEVQIKVPLADQQRVIDVIYSGDLQIVKHNHYRQYDHYFNFSGQHPDAARLRYRDDEYIGDDGRPFKARARLTLLGEQSHTTFPNAVMLSRSRLIAPASNSLRFYQEYFTPETEVEVVKDRRRWRIIYQGEDFAVNIDEMIKPQLPGLFLEIKARTWSRRDAEKKANLISELLVLFGVDSATAELREYAELAQEAMAT